MIGGEAASPLDDVAIGGAAAMSSDREVVSLVVGPLDATLASRDNTKLQVLQRPSAAIAAIILVLPWPIGPTSNRRDHRCRGKQQRMLEWRHINGEGHIQIDLRKR
ncbi:unnamed protein product [Cuscuta europaea]|uniref:Uncharacterized protein n=1 Tax=Cuscuta europaea TaxID=41803 RepID=A0A9P0ZUK6_CUSEU|nr:unnamed protein product [Cuscuta europaea]